MPSFLIFQVHQRLLSFNINILCFPLGNIIFCFPEPYCSFQFIFQLSSSISTCNSLSIFFRDQFQIFPKLFQLFHTWIGQLLVYFLFSFFLNILTCFFSLIIPPTFRTKLFSFYAGNETHRRNLLDPCIATLWKVLIRWKETFIHLLLFQF